MDDHQRASELHELVDQRRAELRQTAARWARADPSMYVIWLVRALDQSEFGAWTSDDTLQSSGALAADVDGWELGMSC